MIFIVETTPSELNLLGRWYEFCHKRNWDNDQTKYDTYERISLSEDEAVELGFLEYA